MDHQSLESGSIYSQIIHKRLDEASHPLSRPLQVARIDTDRLEFASDRGFDQAVTDGIFLLEIPSHIDLDACDEFAAHFSRIGDCPDDPNNYRRFRHLTSELFNDPLLGFHQRSDQIEQFLLESRYWDQHYPPAIAKLGWDLNKISSIIIQAVLSKVGLPEQDWNQATGNCSQAQGSYHLTFNHFRYDMNGVGLSSHKDDGFVTILRAPTQGLEINRDDRWEKIPSNSNCFLINFGLAMELLTKRSRFPVAAILHRVSQQEKERWSWGHFSSSKCDLSGDEGIYQFSEDQGLVKLCDSRYLINNNDHEIYNGTKGS